MPPTDKVDPITTGDAALAAAGSGKDLQDALDLVYRVRSATVNGEALGHILAYRNAVRSDALETKGIPSDMLLVNKVEFDKLVTPSSALPTEPPIEALDAMSNGVIFHIVQRAPAPDMGVLRERQRMVWRDVLAALWKVQTPSATSPIKVGEKPLMMAKAFMGLKPVTATIEDAQDMARELIRIADRADATK